MKITKHPAKFSDSILNVLTNYIPKSGAKVFDPFAGTGKIKNIVDSNWLYLNEIEKEWAIQGKPANIIIGDALILPYSNEVFDTICTSPCYGNRMADHHNAKDGSRRNTYTHILGKKLHKNNSGQMQWGIEYQKFHINAWIECYRVLKNGGLFIVNISNHIRKGKEIFVSEWHEDFFVNYLNLELLHHIKVKTPRNRQGENYKIRVLYENIFVMKKT